MLSYCSRQLSNMAQLSRYTASKASYIILLLLSDMGHLSGYTASQASYVILLQPSAVRYGTLVWVHCKPGKLRYLTVAISCQIWHTCLGTLQARQATLSYCSRQLSDTGTLVWVHCKPGKLHYLIAAVSCQMLIHGNEDVIQHRPKYA